MLQKPHRIDRAQEQECIIMIHVMSSYFYDFTIIIVIDLSIKFCTGKKGCV